MGRRNTQLEAILHGGREASTFADTEQKSADRQNRKSRYECMAGTGKRPKSMITVRPSRVPRTSTSFPPPAYIKA
jgi:hypothetical protein